MYSICINHLLTFGDNRKFIEILPLLNDKTMTDFVRYVLDSSSMVSETKGYFRSLFLEESTSVNKGMINQN